MSPEKKLLLALCRNELNEIFLSHFFKSELKFDWKAFDTLVLQHQLRIFVYHHFYKRYSNHLPSELIKHHKRATTFLTGTNLKITRELKRLCKILTHNEISHYPFKGPIISQLAYGNTTIREFGDLDILVNEEDLLKTVEILQNSCGYELYRHAPLDDPKELKRYKIKNHAIDLVHPILNIYIDLHWSLKKNLFHFYPQLELFKQRSSRLTISNGNCTINTFNRSDSLVVYAINCFRNYLTGTITLKCLVDLSFFLQKLSTDEIIQALQTAEHNGLKTPVSVALKLTATLLNNSLPEEINTLICNNQKVNSMAQLLSDIFTLDKQLSMMEIIQLLLLPDSFHGKFFDLFNATFFMTLPKEKVNLSKKTRLIYNLLIPLRFLFRKLILREK